jgi:hypothetical protein
MTTEYPSTWANFAEMFQVCTFKYPNVRLWPFPLQLCQITPSADGLSDGILLFKVDMSTKSQLGPSARNYSRDMGTKSFLSSVHDPFDHSWETSFEHISRSPLSEAFLLLSLLGASDVQRQPHASNTAFCRRY